MIPENLYRFRHELGCFQRRGQIRFEEKVSEPFKIGERLPGIDQPRQDFAFGFETTFPPARARM